MRVGIASRPNLEGSAALVEDILQVLSGEEIFLAPEIAKRMDKEGREVGEMDLDSLITLGGDGTVLYNVQKKPEIPILGINMGRRGFLADVNPDEAVEAIDMMVKGELEVIERKRLSVSVSGEHFGDALNEGAIRARDPGATISFKVFVDGEEVETDEGDGLIVSTPTGSTAYALAAGGPILHPEVEAFLAIPLSTLHSKVLPLVYPVSKKLEVELQSVDERAYVTVDGQVTMEVGKDEIISFEKARISAKFYTWKGNFYEKIGEKL